MATILFVVSIGLVFSGVILFAFAAERQRKFIAMFGVLLFVGGAITFVVSLRSMGDQIVGRMNRKAVVQENLRQAALDRERRITVVTGMAREAFVAMREGKFVETVVLDSYNNDLAYVCSSDEVASDATPRMGDILRVKFVRPKEQYNGRPEVLEVYNLTYELRKLGYEVRWETPPAK